MARQFFEFPETRHILAPYLDRRGDTWRLILAALDPAAMPSREDLQDMAIRLGSRALLEEFADPESVTKYCWSDEICASLEAFEWFHEKYLRCEGISHAYMDEQVSNMTIENICPGVMKVILAEYWSVAESNLFYDDTWKDIPRELAEAIVAGAPEGSILPGFIPWEDLRRVHYRGVSTASQAAKLLGLEDFDRLAGLLEAPRVSREISYGNLRVVIHDVRGVPEIVRFLCVNCRISLERAVDIIMESSDPAAVCAEVAKYMEIPQDKIWRIIGRAQQGYARAKLFGYVKAFPADFSAIRGIREILDFLHARWPKETAAELRKIIPKYPRVLGVLVDYGYRWDGVTTELSRICGTPDGQAMLAYYYSDEHAGFARLLAAKNTCFCAEYPAEPSVFVPMGFRLHRRWVAKTIEYLDNAEIDYVLARCDEWR